MMDPIRITVNGEEELIIDENEAGEPQIRSIYKSVMQRDNFATVVLTEHGNSVSIVNAVRR